MKTPVDHILRPLVPSRVGERTITVDVGDNAIMNVPTGYWCWGLRYGKDNTPPGVADDRMLAASVCDSYRYLIMECTKEDAWKRIKLMREAINANATKDAVYI